MIGLNKVTAEVTQTVQVPGRTTVMLVAKLEDGEIITVAIQLDGKRNRRLCPQDVIPGDKLEITIVQKE